MRFSNKEVERIGDMQYFRAISPSNPIMIELIDRYGYGAYGRFLAVLAVCQEIGTAKITPELLVRTIDTNKRGAAKLVPMFQETLDKLIVMFGESLVKVYPNFDETLPKVYPNNGESLPKVYPKFTQSLPKLEGQNPDGSTRAHAPAHVLNNINNKYKNINNTEKDFQVWYAAYPHKVGKGQAEKAYATARKKASAEQLLEGLERYKKNKPDYAAWRNPATWLNGLGWEDQYASKSEPVDGPSHGRRLMAAKKIQNRFTGEVVKTEDLTIDKHDQIWTKAGNRFPDNEFEPLEELSSGVS